MGKLGRSRRLRVSAMSRALMNCPQTDQSKIVFPLHGKQFSIHQFNPTLAQNRVNQQEVQEVLEEAASQPHFEIKQPGILYIIPFLMFAFFFGMAGFLFFFASTIIDTNVILLPVIIFGIVFILLALVLLIAFSAGRIKQNNARLREEEINAVLDKYNQTWRSREVSWKIGMMGAWLQLDLDFAIRAMQNNMMAAGPLNDSVRAPLQVGGDLAGKSNAVYPGA